MFKLVHKRGTTAQHAGYTGALSEATYDSDKKTLVIHDGVTPGGNPLATEADVTAQLADIASGVGITAANISTSDGVSVEAGMQKSKWPLEVSLFPKTMTIPSNYNDMFEDYGVYRLVQKKCDAFIMLVKTDNAGTSGSTQFTLPATGTYTVDWGDGVVETLTGAQTHTYALAGQYFVKISDGLTRISFDNDGDKLKLLKIINWGKIHWSTMLRAFNGCTNMDVIAYDCPDLNGCASLQRMFHGCANFVGNKSISSWDTSNITEMYLIFTNTKFNQDISNWKLKSSVVFLESTFASTQMSKENYSKALISFANQVYVNGAPKNVSMRYQTGRKYSNATYNLGGHFNNAVDARAYLTTASPDGAEWTITDDAYEVMSGGNFAGGKLVLTFDDSSASWYNLLFPLLTSKGVNATFFVTGGQVGGSGAVTWEQLKEMRAAGNDLQCHTWTHNSLLLEAEPELRMEYQLVDKAFLEHQIPTPLYTAYPGGGYVQSVVDKIVKGGFRRSGRTINGGSPSIGLCGTSVDKWAVPSKVLGNETIANLSTYQSLLDTAKTQNLALVTYGHILVSTNAEVVNANIATVELVGAIIDYALANGIEVITYSEFFGLLDA